MFAFLYVKANSKEICEKISFPFFFRKIFDGIQGSKKNAGYPNFSLWIPNSPFKDLLFPRGPNVVQKPLYLVGTIVNMKSQKERGKSCSERPREVWELNF